MGLWCGVSIFVVEKQSTLGALTGALERLGLVLNAHLVAEEAIL